MKNYFIKILAIYIFFYSPFSMGQELQSGLLKNLSSDQIELVKDELAKNKPSVNPKPSVSESTFTPANNINKTKTPSNKKFGYSYFSSIPTSLAAVGDLPLPNEYVISLKDQFTIILSGSKDEIFDLDVNLDGTILFPELGSIYVAGETFKEVKTKLTNLINNTYIGVQVDLSLKNLSAKKISIVGAVNNPGTYLVNPFSTISSALAYSGGITEIGTLRNIRLVRTDGEIFNFDLYDLLINGDRSGDITIESGDVIVIDAAEQFIDLSGQIKRPAVYEVVRGENLDNLIAFGLGFTPIANISSINIKILDNKSSTIINKNAINLKSSLINVMSVNVNKFVNKDVTNIYVDGAVKEPGFYSIEESPYLEDLIKKLKFIDVYPWLAVLEQFDDDNLIKTTSLFSLKDQSTYRSIKILPNSKIYFANIDERKFDVESTSKILLSDYELRINHKQGKFNLPVFGKYKVSSFIDYLGLDMSDVNEDATYISPLDNIVIVESYKKMTYVAKKYNTVSFRSPVNDLINVSISGAVDYPGTYTMNSNSVLEDLYKLVGEFKNEAFLEGVIFTRESVRARQKESIRRSKDTLNESLLTSIQEGKVIGDINVIRSLSDSIDPSNLGRIAGNFSPNSFSSINTLLVDGDSIIVPKISNTINVLGEVLNPIAFEYNKNLTVSTAINLAGGFQDYADKRKVYVIKANGIIERSSRNIFVRNVKLMPGDTIVVPRRISVDNQVLESILPATKILSDVAFSAAALESLSKNW